MRPPSPPIPDCLSGFKSWFSTTPRLATRHSEKAPSPPGSYANAGDLYGCCSSSVRPLQEMEGSLPAYELQGDDVYKSVQNAIDSASSRLRDLSLFIHGHPETAYAEHQAHDALTAFLSAEGFSVDRHHLGLPTAFRASYTRGSHGRTFGLCSEYDALPGIGHACGHNLIAVAGVAALLAVRAEMKRSDISGSVVLVGTPAEEGGGGKEKLASLGAFDGLDACMMTHPGTGDLHTAGVARSLAIQVLQVEFHGKTAHAAGAPWEGINALDAASISYAAISALRQQIRPQERVHGIITNGGLAPNVIPDFTSMKYYVRAPTKNDVDSLRERVSKCFEAAALATGCTYTVEAEPMHLDLRNNKLLASAYQAAMRVMFNWETSILLEVPADGGGSTDFGNVTYLTPSLHPTFAIPSTPGQGNHTPGFTAAAATLKAHEQAMASACGLAVSGVKILSDESFSKEAMDWWKDDMAR